MSAVKISGLGAVQQMSIEGLDLESMLMAVQSNRVNLLDQQLKDQMTAVQNRNNRINELNVSMNGMNAALAKVGTGATDALSGQNKTDFLAAAPKVVDEEAMERRANGQSANYASHLDTGVASNTSQNAGWLKEEMLKQGYPVSAAMADLPTTATGTTAKILTPSQQATINSEAAAFSTWLKDPNSPVAMKVDPKAAECDTRAKAEAYIKAQQSEIDALGNSQQMDMLRLQSLSNKRNEAFEIMTNFMKKLSDSRSGIIQKF